MEITGSIGEILKNKGTQIWSVAPDTTVFDAITLMAEKNVGALLVLSGTRLIGIVSERDYTRKVALKGRASKQTLVQEIVSTPVIAATPSHSITDCMKLMTENRVRHLPVLEGDLVVGVVSIGDLVNWTISAQSAAIHQLENFISGGYPG